MLPGSTVGEVDGFGIYGRCAEAETPSDFVAFGSGAKFALLAFGRGFECTTAAHFLKNSFGIEFGFEAFESAIDWLSFFDVHSTHADKFRWFVADVSLLGRGVWTGMILKSSSKPSIQGVYI